jgi:hypothetical protein
MGPPVSASYSTVLRHLCAFAYTRPSLSRLRRPRAFRFTPRERLPKPPRVPQGFFQVRQKLPPALLRPRFPRPRFRSSCASSSRALHPVDAFKQVIADTNGQRSTRRSDLSSDNRLAHRPHRTRRRTGKGAPGIGARCSPGPDRAARRPGSRSHPRPLPWATS